MILVGLGLSLAVGIVLLAFSWPTVTASPRDLPIGIVGSGPQATAVAAELSESADDAFDPVTYDDRHSAVEAIRERKVYGAVVLGSSPSNPPEVLTASAAGPPVAQMLAGLAHHLEQKANEQIAEALASGRPTGAGDTSAPADSTAPASPAQPAIEVTVTDVVPFSDDDRKGAGLATSVFPLVIGGLIGGAITALTVRGSGPKRAAAIIVYAAFAGCVLTGILQGWYGVLQGDFMLNALAIGLGLAAISGTITGLAGMVGPAGIGVGAVLMILVANPLSGTGLPPEFIVWPWGQVGQWMPVGAAGTLVRELSYFPDAAMLFPWLVLASWAFVGLLLTALGRRGDLDEAIRSGSRRMRP